VAAARDTALLLDPACGVALGSTCESAVAGHQLSFDYTLTMPFEYGVNIFMVMELSAGVSSWIDTVPGWASLYNRIDRITLPEGALLTSASGQVSFDDGSWRYRISPVPAGDSLYLMVAGLLMLALRKIPRRSVMTLLAALLLHGYASASPARDQWNLRARDTADRAAMAFTDIVVSGMDGNYTSLQVARDHWGVGESAGALFGNSADASAAAGRVAGGLSVFPYIADDNGQFMAGWRDVLRVDGGTGRGIMTITGKVDLSINASLPSVQFRPMAFTDGAFGWNEASAFGSARSSTYAHAYGEVSLSTQCGPLNRSVCNSSLNGNRVVVGYTMTLPFEYGADVFLLLELEGHGAAGYIYGSLIDAHPGLSIESITLPTGATLDSASGLLALQGGAWRYVTAVPEPATAVLALAGLLMLLALRAGGRGRTL
jgi:hypothetical protein